VLILVILVVAVPSAVYYTYFNQPITKAPTATETSSTSSSTGGSGTTTTTTTTTQAASAAPGFIASSPSCGFGLTYGSPGGEGCFVYVLNNSNSTLTLSGTCSLTFGGSTYGGTFSDADPLPPGQSSGKVTCGTTNESPPAGKGTVVTGQVFFTSGQYVDYNGTASS
jgi:hypothetical protein